MGLRHLCNHRATKAGSAALAAIADGRRPKIPEAEKDLETILSSHPAGNEVAQKRPFSTGIRSLPLSPLLEGSACSEPGVSPRVKKPKTEQSHSLRETCPRVCNEGCPKTGWTIDQFCEVCHSSLGHGVPEECPSLSRPSGAEVALVAPDRCSNQVFVHPGTVAGCVNGNGLCPLEGWTISSYCPVCHQ